MGCAVFAMAPTPHTEPRAASGCAGLRPGNASLTLTSGGLKRAVRIHVPPVAGRSRRLPLVLALHGAGGDGLTMESSTGLSRLSDREGFLVAYPSAYGSRRRWNIAGASGAAPDDVAFMRQLLDDLAQRNCVNPRRVFATGVSNGGGMVARLGCDLSDRLEAVAPVAGGYSTLPPCRPARPVSVLEIHGWGDPVVPYTGREPTHEGSVREFIENWLARDRCPRKPVRTVPAARVRRADWSPCKRHSAVAHIKMLDGGHAWPGGAALTEQRKGRAVLSATQQVWRFFAAR